MASGCCFSHTTAAALLGLRLPEGRRHPSLHVTAGPGVRAPRGRGIVGHATTIHRAPIDVQQLRCTSATDTWCDLAELLTLEELIVVGDGLVSRTAALCTLDDLVAAVGLRAGRSGCGMLRAALARVRPRTDSPRETRLRLLVVDAGLPEPVVNHAVLDRRRRFIGYADLAYPDLRIAIEYEGDHHRSDPAQWERDIRRYEQMERAGWTVVRITAAGIADAAGCVERIERAMAGAARA